MARFSPLAGDLPIQWAVDPNKVGLNTDRVTLSDAQGAVSNASLVRLDFHFADPRIGTSNTVCHGQTGHGNGPAAAPQAAALDSSGASYGSP